MKRRQRYGHSEKRLQFLFTVVFIVLILSSPSYAQDSLNVRWINACFGNSARDVTYSEIENNKYTFVSLHGSILILNVNDPSHPQKIKEIGHPGEGWLNPLQGCGIAVYDTLFLIACGHYGLWIYNIAVPSNPVRLSTCKTPRASNVAVSGNYAYVADAESGLIIIDISDLTSPQIISNFYIPPPGGVDVVVSDTIAYVAGDEVWIINISNPYQPALISIWNPHNLLEAVTQIDKEGNFLYVTETGISVCGFWIIDVSNPSNPISADSIRVGWARYIDASGQYAYCTAGVGLMILNISNPYNSYPIVTLNIGEDGQGLCSAGNYVYVAAMDSTLIVDASNPANPTIIGVYSHFKNCPRYIVVANNYGYVSMGVDGLRIIDISDPYHLTEIGYCDTPGAAAGIALSDSYAYIADGDSGLRVIDITNPYSPYEIGNLILPNYSFKNIVIDGTYAYIASGIKGLTIVDISNPSSPFFVSSLSPSGGYINATNIVKYRNYIYLLCAAGGVRIIDVSNPYHPFGIGRFKDGCSGGTGFNGDYALVTGCGPIYSVDIDDPSSLVPVDSLSTYYNIGMGDVKLMLHYAVAGGDGIPLYIVDFADPFNIVLSGYYYWNHHISEASFISIALKDNSIFITTDYGLQIFQFYGATGIAESLKIPKTNTSFTLNAEPNPFINNVKINWQIPSDMHFGDRFAQIMIFDVLGRVVKTYSIDKINHNENYVIWDSSDNSNHRLPPGVYFCCFSMNNHSVTKKIILLK
ncbi:MAG: T9SS type A sorting domain-containing protein [candidate division WOR-3 bacterium]